MHSGIPEKLLALAQEIGAHGNASLTRLTVLKKWFDRPARLAAFAIWMGARAISRKGKSTGGAAELFIEGRVLLGRVNAYAPQLDRDAAEQLHGRLQAFQNEYRHQQWGPVRMVHNWNLMLLEQALEIYLWHTDSASHGYRLAADYCQHFDPRHGNGLNGPSRAKIKEIVRFLVQFEALADQQ
jgi:hypothetical protein